MLLKRVQKSLFYVHVIKMWVWFGHENRGQKTERKIGGTNTPNSRVRGRKNPKKGKRNTTDKQIKELKAVLEVLHTEVKSAERYHKHIH